jgi:hypothetical protein
MALDKFSLPHRSRRRPALPFFDPRALQRLADGRTPRAIALRSLLHHFGFVRDTSILDLTNRMKGAPGGATERLPPPAIVRRLLDDGVSFGPRALVLGLWTLFGIAAVVEGAVVRLLPGRTTESLLLRQDLWLLAMWALAVPAIVGLVRRYPIRDASALAHALLHFLVASALIVMTNVAIRLPLMAPPFSMRGTAIARGTLLGLARFYPAALMLYGVIVALAHRAWRRPPAPAPGARRFAHPFDRSQDRSAAATEPGGRERPAHPAPPAARGGRSDRVVIREWNRVRLVRASDIQWIEADDNYVVVHVGERTFKGRGRIGDLESQLDPSSFVRVHRSAIVRVASIREVQPLTKGDLALVLNDGKVLRVARGRRAALEAAIGVTI